MRKKKPVLLAAIFTDPFGSIAKTQEAEEEETRSEFEEATKDFTYKWYSIPCLHPDYLKPHTDLILFDFGGMLFGSGDLVRSNANEVIKWAQDNPSSLVVVISSFTMQTAIQSELEDMGLTELFNVLYQIDLYKDGYIEYPEWFKVGRV